MTQGGSLATRRARPFPPLWLRRDVAGSGTCCRTNCRGGGGADACWGCRRCSKRQLGMQFRRSTPATRPCRSETSCCRRARSGPGRMVVTCRRARAAGRPSATSTKRPATVRRDPARPAAATPWAPVPSAHGPRPLLVVLPLAFWGPAVTPSKKKKSVRLLNLLSAFRRRCAVREEDQRGHVRRARQGGHDGVLRDRFRRRDALCGRGRRGLRRQGEWLHREVEGQERR